MAQYLSLHWYYCNGSSQLCFTQRYTGPYQCCPLHLCSSCCHCSLYWDFCIPVTANARAACLRILSWQVRTDYTLSCPIPGLVDEHCTSPFWNVIKALTRCLDAFLFWLHLGAVILVVNFDLSCVLQHPNFTISHPFDWFWFSSCVGYVGNNVWVQLIIVLLIDVKVLRFDLKSTVI